MSLALLEKGEAPRRDKRSIVCALFAWPPRNPRSEDQEKSPGRNIRKAEGLAALMRRKQELTGRSSP